MPGKAGSTNLETRRRAVAIRKDGSTRTIAGVRGPVADAMVALAAARGIEVRRDDDLAEVLSALDPETATSDAAAALTAALLDRLYRLNAAAKQASAVAESGEDRFK